MFKDTSIQVSETNTETNVVSLVEVKAKAVNKVYKVSRKGDPKITKVLEAFLNTNTKRLRVGQYFIDGDQLVYRATVVESGKVELRENVIAQKFKQRAETLVVGNSSALGLIGRYVSYGNEVVNRDETEVQRRLSVLVPMIPFSVFQQAGLDIRKLRIVARGKEETITRKRHNGKFDKQHNPIMIEETVHFTGSSLFKVDGSLFLFDIDRREIGHKIFNPFLVRLPQPVTTIEDAYESLKPQEVKDAEAKGLEVKRQGEWFFIPVDKETARKLDNIEEHNPECMKSLTLSAGPNRPNYARGIQMHRGAAVPDESEARWTDRSKRDKASEFFCKGKVEHSGREHAALLLKGWYRALPNTATESFTITGDID
jgi:hypothetical protein